MDFWTQIKKSGQEVAGKAKDVAELTKLQLTQREQEAKVEKLYTQLGRRFYETAQIEEGAELFELAQEIGQLRAEIEALKEQQAVLRGGTRCAACGAMMEPNAAFCPECGTRKEAERAPEAAAEAESGRVSCPQCGRSVEPKAFCAVCGTKLS